MTKIMVKIRVRKWNVLRTLPQGLKYINNTYIGSIHIDICIYTDITYSGLFVSLGLGSVL